MLVENVRSGRQGGAEIIWALLAVRDGVGFVLQIVNLGQLRCHVPEPRPRDNDYIYSTVDSHRQLASHALVMSGRMVDFCQQHCVDSNT